MDYRVTSEHIAILQAQLQAAKNKRKEAYKEYADRKKQVEALTRVIAYRKKELQFFEGA